MNKKDRRNSGRKEPHILPHTPLKELINEALEPQKIWDDWNDHRDGYRALQSERFVKYEWSKSEKQKKLKSLREKKLLKIKENLNSNI